MNQRIKGTIKGQNEKTVFVVLLCVVNLMMLLTIPIWAQQCSMTKGVSEKWIRVNELMSDNSYFAPLDDGSCYDWVELHNPSDTAIDIKGFGLSDSSSMPLKWTVPDSVLVEPGEYIVIYLSGYDMVDEYGNLHTNFKLSGDGEEFVFSGPDGQIIQHINIPRCIVENVSYGFTEYDGKETFLWMAEPSPGRLNEGDMGEDATELIRSTVGVVINEFMTNNTYTIYDCNNEYSDWIEIYNPTSVDVDLTGCSLGDNAEGMGVWFFPDGTVCPANGYLLVFCSGKVSPGEELHAGFRLGGDDEDICIYSSSGVPCDRVKIPAMNENVSCGRDSATGELRLYSSPTPGRENSTVSYELNRMVYSASAGGVYISEAMSVSSNCEGDEYTMDFIELYNSTDEAVLLKGYTLSESSADNLFEFEEATIGAHDYLVVYCTGAESRSSEQGYYAPFKLDRGGECILFSDAEGRLVDSFSICKQTYGRSSGRINSDTQHQYIFSAPTPGEENSSSFYAGYAGMPIVSDGGYVEPGHQVTITAQDGCKILYTTDGSEPTMASKEYIEPITILDNVVIRARCYREGYLPSQVVSVSFFVDELHSLPVLSIASCPEDLFSEQTGIFSEAIGFGTTSNYMYDVERNASIEYFENGKKAVSFDAGIRNFGEGSRHYAQKSIAVMLREKYGCNTVSFPFFNDCEVSVFSNFVIRQGGQDWNRAKMRDVVCARISKGYMDVEYQEAQSVAVYINGEYWGIYHLREKLNEDYLINKYGYTKGQIDIIKIQSVAQAGSIDAYKQLSSFVAKNDMSLDENYKLFCDQVDIESFIDMWIGMTFYANPDSGNVRCYRDCNGGKWRWMQFDMDYGLNTAYLEKNMIEEHMLDPNGHGIINHLSNLMTRKLFLNKDFEQLFIERYCMHLKTTFATERTVGIVQMTADEMKDEMPRQYAKWGEPSPESWLKSVDVLVNFLEKRPEIVCEHLKETFDLSDKEFERIYKNA